MNVQEMRRRGFDPADRFASMAAPPARADRSEAPLAYLLPPSITIPGWFGLVPVAAPAIDTGKSAWYKFQSIRVPEDTGEMGLLAVAAEMLPPDVDGAGDGTNSGTGWGNARGLGAAIVVGFNLPGDFQTWASGPPMPRTEVAAGSPALLNPRLPARHPFITTFPTGKFSDTTPNKASIIRSVAPGLNRVPAGANLDMSLVIERAKIHGVTGNIIGHAIISAILVPTSHTANFGQ